MLPYTEVQRFRQLWILIPVFALVGIAIMVIMQQSMSDPLPEKEVIPPFAIVILIAVPVLAVLLFLMMRLETRIDETGVAIRFIPFHFSPKKFRWDEISKVYVRKYKPVIEYGGWGIRYKPFKKSIAYNVSGKQGLQLELKNGKKILVGTQNPEEVNRVIVKLREKNILRS
jgi:hypothetical protein